MQATQAKQQFPSVQEVTHTLNRLTLDPCQGVLNRVLTEQKTHVPTEKTPRKIGQFSVMEFIVSKGIFPIREFVLQSISSKKVHDLLFLYHGIDCKDIPETSSQLPFWHIVHKRISDMNLCRLWTRLESQVNGPHFSNADDIRRWIVENPKLVQKASELQLNLCHLTYLPEEIGCFINLKVLSLYDNSLFSLPETFVNLQSLQRLNLSSNCFDKIPQSICSLRGLEELTMSYNRLDKLPKEIENLSSLSSLFLQGNKLQSIPKTFGNLSALKNLSLQENKFSDFPLTICNLKKVEFLRITDNNLTEVPRQRGELHSLRFLDVSRNPLTRLPVELALLKNLQCIFRYNTPNICLSSGLQRSLNTQGIQVFPQVASL